MTELTANLDAAYRASVIEDFYAIEIVLPSATIRLIDGAGFVNFPVDNVNCTFKGKDDIYGVLSAADKLQDGFGDNAPAFSFTMQAATDGAAAALTDLSNQGSSVRVWSGVRNPETNAVYGVSLRFDGFLDFATIEGDLNSIAINFQCVTWAELFFYTAEGVNLSDAFHKSLYPGEAGLAYMTGIQRSIIWGPGERPNNLIYSGKTTGAGGGAGGVGGGGWREARARLNLH